MKCLVFETTDGLSKGGMQPPGRTISETINGINISL